MLEKYRVASYFHETVQDPVEILDKSKKAKSGTLRASVQVMEQTTTYSHYYRT